MNRIPIKDKKYNSIQDWLNEKEVHPSWYEDDFPIADMVLDLPIPLED